MLLFVLLMESAMPSAQNSVIMLQVCFTSNRFDEGRGGEGRGGKGGEALASEAYMSPVLIDGDKAGTPDDPDGFELGAADARTAHRASN